MTSVVIVADCVETSFQLMSGTVLEIISVQLPLIGR